MHFWCIVLKAPQIQNRLICDISSHIFPFFYLKETFRCGIKKIILSRPPPSPFGQKSNCGPRLISTTNIKMAPDGKKVPHSWFRSKKLSLHLYYCEGLRTRATKCHSDTGYISQFITVSWVAKILHIPLCCRKHLLHNIINHILQRAYNS